jgi:hypothetical protein
VSTRRRGRLRASVSHPAERRNVMLAASIAIPGIIVLIVVVLIILYFVRRA